MGEVTWHTGFKVSRSTTHCPLGQRAFRPSPELRPPGTPLRSWGESRPHVGGSRAGSLVARPTRAQALSQPRSGVKSSL